MNKYEQLIEHIINDETDKARELFHTIVVEKSRDIYESLIDEQDLEEVGGNRVEDLVDEVTIDEQGISEEEEDGEEAAEFDAEEGEEEDGEEHEEAELEDRVVDLEDALDELKAEFDALMAGEADEPEHADLELGSDEGEEEQDQFFESAEDEEEDDEEEEEDLDETIVREYVEKVGDTGQKNPSGKMAGAGTNTPASGETNPKSPVAGKNDMGGSSANIVRGKANPSPDGTSPHPTAKTKGELIGKVENSPGADAGKAFSKKEGAVKKEEGAVNKTTPVAK